MNFINFLENDFKAVYPELFLTTAILSLLTYGVIYGTSDKYDKATVSAEMAWLCIQSFALTLVLLVTNSFGATTVFNNLLIIDSASSVVKGIILVSAAACLAISLTYLKVKKIVAFEYHLLISLATLGLILISSAYDFLSAYLAIELTSLSFYVLAAFNRKSELSTEAGLKYFILGAFASGLLLFGFSLIYGFTGLTNFGQLAQLLAHNNSNPLITTNVLTAGILFICAGLLFKVAAVPFHMWAPDVYEGASTPVTAFFAIVPKISLLLLLIRICMTSFYDFIETWQQFLALSALLSLLTGTFISLYQNKLKRFLAYSAIGHIGYLLIGLATGTELGLQGLFLYIFFYIVMGLGTFSVMLSLKELKNTNFVMYITDLAGLGKSNPALALTFTLILFSIAGIPPLAGFYSKFYIFLAAVDSSLYLLAIAGVLASVIGCLYYIRLIKLMYFENEETITVYSQMSKETSIVLAVVTALLVGFFLNPSPIFLLIHKMVLSLGI